MNSNDWTAKLRSLHEPRGPLTRVLRVGPWQIVLEGLDAELAAKLDRRWGPFVSTERDAAPCRVVRVVRAGTTRWLAGEAVGEVYRLEAERGLAGTAVRSHHFALVAEVEPSSYRCGLVDQALEPLERALENAVRYLVARLAVEAGGVALHGATVLRDGKGWIFAGPSRSGKSTAVALSAPGQSLGDDFAAVIPSGSVWQTMAVPFDNREVAPEGAPKGLLPLAGIFRLFQAPAARVESVRPLLAVSSLLACAAMAPAMPDQSAALVANVERFVATSRFAHLHFRNSPEFWPLLES